jgi:hypothetical protein
MRSHKTIKPAPSLSRYALLGRREAERCARLDAGTDSTTADAASDLLCTLWESPTILAEHWAEQHGDTAPAAFALYQSGFLSRLCELAPSEVQ